VFREVRGRDRKLPGITADRADAMVHEHERGHGHPSPRQHFADSARSEHPHGENHTPELAFHHGMRLSAWSALTAGSRVRRNFTVEGDIEKTVHMYERL